MTRKPLRMQSQAPSLLRRSRLGLLLFGACALVAYRAHAFSLKVTPIPITLADGATSTMAEIGNESDEALRVQATAFDWTIDQTSGQDQTAPTGELLIFPSFITIQPHSSRKVRIGTQGGYGASEKCFRVMFAEIPPDFTPVDGGSELLKVIAHISVPVFVRPPGVKGVIKIEGLTAAKDKAHFVIRDTGTAHVMVERIRLEALGAGGSPIASAEVAGWYVLPGQTRPFDVDFVKSGFNCAGAKQLVFTAISTESGSTSAVVDNPACAR